MTSFVPWFRKRLVQHLAGDVLEIGVGSGANLPYYQRATQVCAIEPDFEQVQAAHALAADMAEHIHVVVAVAEFLPFASAAFDEVVSSLVFCSVADQVQALTEIERVVKPTGALHMVEHVRPTTRWLAHLFAALTPYWSRHENNCHLDRPTVTVLHNQGWKVDLHWRRAMLVRLTARPPEATLYPGARKPGEQTHIIDQ